MLIKIEDERNVKKNEIIIIITFVNVYFINKIKDK